MLREDNRRINELEKQLKDFTNKVNIDHLNDQILKIFAILDKKSDKEEVDELRDEISKTND